MTVLVPDFAQDMESKFDQIFIAWMYRIAEQNGWRHGYNIHPHDVRLICQRYFMNPTVSFEDYFHYFLFGNYGSENWMFKWKRVPTASPVLFTGERENLIWGYLLGREADEELVEDLKGWNHRTKGILTSRELGQFRYNAHEKGN